MDNQKIKRGIDFENRVGGESGIAHRINDAFIWWKGGKLNKNSLFFIGLVFIINLLVVFPLFTRDVTASYSSAFLLAIASLLEKIGIHRSQFFSLMTIVSLSFAPVGYYLFVRRMALRHELTAFLATLIFIVPSPLSKDGLPLAQAILSGDGGHAFAFFFIPLLLLYAQAFIANGLPAWGAIVSIGTAIIAIISPFAMFNLLIIFSIIALAEGFLGNFRIKLIRLLFLLVLSFGLSFFWYYPNIVAQATLLSHVNSTINKLLSVFPILIPVIPVFGVLSFLVFDKREKLKPLFIGVSLFLIYFFLTSASSALNISGIFTADRYLIESSFVKSFLFAILFILLTEFFVRKYVLKTIEKQTMRVLWIAAGSFLVSILGFLSFLDTKAAHATFKTEPILNSYNLGIGNIERTLSFHDPFSIFAVLISVATLVLIIYILKKFSLFSNLSLVIKEEKK